MISMSSANFSNDYIVSEVWRITSTLSHTILLYLVLLNFQTNYQHLSACKIGAMLLLYSIDVVIRFVYVLSEKYIIYGLTIQFWSHGVCHLKFVTSKVWHLRNMCLIDSTNICQSCMHIAPILLKSLLYHSDISYIYRIHAYYILLLTIITAIYYSRTSSI